MEIIWNKTNKIQSLFSFRSFYSSLFQQKSNQMRYKSQEKSRECLSSDELFDCHDDLINYSLPYDVAEVEASFFASLSSGRA